MRYHLLSKLAWILPVLCLLPGAANAANYKFCMYYHTSTSDSNIGEDYYSSTTWWLARGARVRVRPQIWGAAPVFNDYARSTDGCFEFSSSHTSFYVDLYAQTRLGPNNNISIDAVAALTPDTTEAGYWTIVTSPNLAPGTHYFYGPASALSNLIAIASYTYYAFDTTGGTPRNSKVLKVRLKNESCPGISNNSCASVPPRESPAQRGVVNIHPDSNSKKFLIAHEMGHMIFGLFRGDGVFDPEYDCGFNGGGQHCVFTSGHAHSIHSKEYQSCAMFEGFAHFVATDVFNNHGTQDALFHYYKTGFPEAINVEEGPVGGSTQFMELMCTGPESYGGYGVGLDWQRTFWDYHTDVHGTETKPSHFEIMEQIRLAQVQSGYVEENVYSWIAWAAANRGFGLRWQGDSEWNGIDHNPTP
jgi:hypothetical protein